MDELITNKSESFISENRKFILNKSNLNIVHLIQQIIYINIKTYKDEINKNYNESFNLICDNYLLLNSSHSIKNCWTYTFESEKIKKYIIKESSDIIYFLFIDLDKSYNNCAKLGGIFSGRELQPVSINVFNVQFEGE